MGNKEVLPYLVWAISRCTAAMCRSRKMVHSSPGIASRTSRGLAGLGPADRGQKPNRTDRRGAGQETAPRSAPLLEKSASQRRGVGYHLTRNWARSIIGLRCGRRRRKLWRSFAHAPAAQRFAFFARTSVCPVGKNGRGRAKISGNFALSPDDAEALKALQDLGKRY